MSNSLLDMLGLEVDTVDWWQLSKCRNMDTDLFYDTAENNPVVYTNITKSLCYMCPVKMSCLKYGVENKEYGIWGGIYLNAGVPKKLHKDK